MHVVALAVQLDQLGLEVGADLGEDSSECFDSLAIKAAVAAFGDKDQMDVHCRRQCLPCLRSLILSMDQIIMKAWNVGKPSGSS